MKKYHIILDCDTKNEIDDQFAITYALAHPAIQLEGVVSVQNNRANGDSSVALYHREACLVLRLAKSSVPAFPGSSRPIGSAKKPEHSKGVDFIIEKARQLKNRLTLIGTGPATDMANALLIEPDIMKQCRYIWIGGFRDNKEMLEYKAGECNFYGDPSAYEIITQFHPDLTVLPAWNVTSRMILQCRPFAEKLEATRSPLNKYLALLLRSRTQTWWVMWDVAAVAAGIHFGITGTRSAPAVRIVRNKPVYQSSCRIRTTLVTDIDEFAILSDFSKRLVSKKL